MNELPNLVSGSVETESSFGQVEVKALSVEVGEAAERFTALDRLNFALSPGEFVCVLGPSGCGKSTLLGAIAGHLIPNEGQIFVDGELVLGPHRNRGLVFQQHTLFPWKRVIDNVAFGLKMSGTGRAERYREARELLDLVGLHGFEQRFPAQLSGGMQQRVEIARALINRPRVLLMDEPFGALDAQTRRMMQDLVLKIWMRVRTTVLFVTHDIDEALCLADRILVLSHRPATIVADITVPLAKPRDEDMTMSPEFIEIKRHCMTLLRNST